MDEYDRWVGALHHHVRTVPPTCLGDLKPEAANPVEWDDGVKWRLRCACGGQYGKLLGYSLADLNPEYTGDPLYVSPLAFLCASCDAVIEFFDSKEHGYDAEITKGTGAVGDCNVRGESGIRMTAPCLSCGATVFDLQMRCSHAHLDLIEDEPELASRVQDYFDWMMCTRTCQQCQQSSMLVSFELA
ncbi:MAG: hypothetical protein AAF432_02640 [Planctomycetota bacterium]